MSNEQLTELLKVADKAAEKIRHPDDCDCMAQFNTRFRPATCAALVREVLRLRREIADYEQTNLVPRSRWEATNNDWLEARQQYQDLAQRAAVEIERLEAKNGEQP